MIQIVVARNLVNTIGKNGTTPWNVPEDLQMFQRLTSGTDIVMGRKTWDSLPHKPLKGRRNYVLTKSSLANCFVCHSINDVPMDNLSVIGGESVYSLFLDIADEIHLTTVFDYTIGDTFFEFDETKWKTKYETNWFRSETGTKYSYAKLVRK